MSSAVTQNQDISIHALLAESDHRFSSRLIPRDRNFYPRSPCGERQGQTGQGVAGSGISIHALLAESDPNHTGFIND